MNAPLSHAMVRQVGDSEAAPIGSPEHAREFLSEMAWFAGVQAGLIQTYAEVGDDAGMEYAVRRLTAYTKTILSTMLELRQLKAGEARE